MWGKANGDRHADAQQDTRRHVATDDQRHGRGAGRARRGGDGDEVARRPLARGPRFRDPRGIRRRPRNGAEGPRGERGPEGTDRGARRQVTPDGDRRAGGPVAPPAEGFSRTRNDGTAGVRPRRPDTAVARPGRAIARAHRAWHAWRAGGFARDHPGYPLRNTDRRQLGLYRESPVAHHISYGNRPRARPIEQAPSLSGHQALQGYNPCGRACRFPSSTSRQKTFTRSTSSNTSPRSMTGISTGSPTTRSRWPWKDSGAPIPSRLRG